MPNLDPEDRPSMGRIASKTDNKSAPTPTIIIDRCPLFREGLKEALRETFFTVLASAAYLNEVRSVEHPHDESLLVILASSCDFADDLAAVKDVHQRFPGSRIVALRRDCSRQQAAMLLRAGVAAILPIPDRPENLANVLNLVMLGQHVVPLYLMGCCAGLSQTDTTLLIERDQRSQVGNRDRGLSRLSTREIEIVRCLLAGEPNRSIAHRLMISEATVKVHVKAILRKIKAKNRTQAAIWALNNVEAVDNLAGASVASLVSESLGARQIAMI